MTDHKTLTDKFWALFETNKLEELGALVDADITFRMPGMGEMRGWPALQQMLAAYRAAFPDLRHQVSSHVVSGDTIAVELVAEGTHTGPMRTPQGVVAPTGKKVRLTMSGEGTELDKTVVERLGEPLTHLIRNAVDHGIEAPEERIARGKPVEGALHLRLDVEVGLRRGA